MTISPAAIAGIERARLNKRIAVLETQLRHAGQVFELLTAFEPTELSEVKVIARKSANDVRKVLECVA